MGAFKAYDFRGVFGKDFDLDTVYKFGFFLPSLLKTDKVLVGRDMRLSTPQMFEALSRGITDAGADVYDMGMTTTPMVYYFTAQHHFDASVMITASHNPKEHNGLKVSRTNALPVGYDSGLGELERCVREVAVRPAEKKGRIIPHEVKAEYLAFQARYHHDLSNLRIVMDCSNGMASILVKEIFGDAPIYLFDTLDGTFPNHEANPLEPENVVALQEKVREMKADIGVIFDGDADRVMFVDEKGDFIAPDLMIAVLGHYFLEEKHYTGKVIQDIRTSKSVAEYLAKMGGEMEIWRVGRAYAALKLREIDGAFGGEFAGHYYFRDFFYSDSAMIASQVLLHVFSDMKKRGISVSQLIAKIKQYANSGEINFTIEQKKEAMEAVKEHFCAIESPAKILDFDGYRVEFADWWFNIRPSNTEPYLRLLMEARTEAMLQEKLEEMKGVLKRYMVG
ncbi:MAG: phosphomannomutase/phosphoglucomutase [Bacteroidales bacterium]|nr:phosphomannomutase/phosphoglucomutase [Bacteroidales bacterium]